MWNSLNRRARRRNKTATHQAHCKLLSMLSFSPGTLHLLRALYLRPMTPCRDAGRDAGANRAVLAALAALPAATLSLTILPSGTTRLRATPLRND